jgi:hypothetical protein
VLQNLIPLAVIPIGFALLPLPWGLRAWALVTLFALWKWALTPITPFQNEDFLDGFAVYLAAWFVGLATVGLAAKAAVDKAIAVLFGIWSGVCATVLLAVALRGQSGGLALHFGVAFLALLALVAANRLPFHLRILTVTTLTTLSCLVVAGGLFYPLLILKQAKLIHPEELRCLLSPDGSTPTTDQLRLLTLPEAMFRNPNLVLTVMTEDGPQDYRWSYRSFAFRTYGSYNGSSCPEQLRLP